MNILNTNHPIAAATRFYNGGGGSAPQRNLYQETAGELQARLDLTPNILAAESQYRPIYQALELQNLQQLLMGTPAGSRTEQYYENELVPASRVWRGGSRNPNAPIGSGFGGNGHWEDVPASTRPVLRSRTVNMPAQRGLLALLEEDLLPASDRLTAGSLSRQREAEIADVELLGGRATQAYRNANPEQAALMGELNRQALEELQAGAHLDPSLRREVQQAVRQGQAARGMGLGLNDLADESFMDALTADQLRRQRQAFASGIVGLNQATSIDPFLATLGRPALNVGQGNQLLNTSRQINAGAGPQLFGSTINANDVFDSNFNAAAADRISDRNNAAATQGAIIGGVGTIGAAALIAL